MKKINVNKIKLSKFILFAILLFFILVIARISVLALSTEIDGINIKKFVSGRNTRKKIIYAERGTIYDVSGSVLAQTINSYTVIAYLDESRSEGFNTPQHVVDKENTAKELSPLLGMSEKAILYLLNQDSYQVELGPGGRGITELKKEKIQELKLPGISFISSYKRYYPNNNFASYVLGYVKTTDSGELIGEMGIESYYNDMLKGEDGYTIYQQDINGYKIPNTTERTKNSTDGVNIYLTVDSNIQYFAEQYTKEAYEKHTPDWAITVVADAKTGAILASTSYPSFDPNIKDMTNYLNPLVSYSFEPGSTMKIFTYMAAMEKKVYNGNDKYVSGSIKFGSNEIYDWLREGFGTVTFDQGFLYSSNVAVANLIKKYFDAEGLRTYFEKFGFGEKTGIELPGEVSGAIDFTYPVEVATAGFGQGIAITPIQMIQAMTTISNNGTMLKPYIVDKIVDSNTDEIIYQGSKKELKTTVSDSTVNKMKDLMYDVIYKDSEYSTGSNFRITGYDLIGKTGTAQYIDSSTGTYYTDNLNYIRSFIGMFPKDNPQIIIYTLMKKPYNGAKGLTSIVKGLVKDISNYKGIYSTNVDTDVTSYKLENYMNKDIDIVVLDLKNKFKDVIVIGNGKKIISQYPNANSTLSVTEKIYLVTNGTEKSMPDLKYWSLKEVSIFTKLTNIKLEYEGSGYVYEQNIQAGQILKDNDKLKIKLKNKIEST